MATQYTYPLSDFPNYPTPPFVSLGQLVVEIDDSVIVPILIDIFIDEPNNNIVLTFDAALSAPEIVVLNNIIANHFPAPTGEPVVASSALPQIDAIQLGATNPNGGIIIEAGKYIDIKAGDIRVKSSNILWKNQPAHVTLSGIIGALNLTPANILTGILVGPAGLVGILVNLPTAVSMIAALTDPEVNDSIDFSIINTGILPTATYVLSNNTGTTIIGQSAVPIGNAGRFTLRITAVGTPAYTVYRIA